MSTKAIAAKLTPMTVWTLLLFLYNDWVLAPVLNPGLSTHASLISEISARTQPYHWVFQTLDIGAGMLTLVLLPCTLRLLGKQPAIWRWLLFAGVALIGSDSIIDAMLPLSCAPSVDVHCSISAMHSLITDAHMVESTVIGAVTFIAPVLWWLRFRASRLLLAQSSALFIVLQMGVALGVVIAHRNETAVVGLLQRFYQLSIGCWLALVISSGIRAAQRYRAARQTSTPELPTARSLLASGRATISANSAEL